jgi:predicted dehydrogenase
MFNKRNNPLYQKIKEIVDAGEIGQLRHTSWIITTCGGHILQQSEWRATWGGEGGGVLGGQAPHQLDLRRGSAAS